MKVYYQWDHDGTIVLTPECSKELGCPSTMHNLYGIYWAWDRSIGAWIHYAR